MTTIADWSGTHTAPGPTDHLYASALWRSGHQCQLAALVDRTSGSDEVAPNESGPDLDALASAVAEHNQDVWTRQDCCFGRYWGADADSGQQWFIIGPAAAPPAKALNRIGESGRARTRSLATFRPARIPVRVSGCQKSGAAGHPVVVDWTTAASAR